MATKVTNQDLLNALDNINDKLDLGVDIRAMKNGSSVKGTMDPTITDKNYERLNVSTEFGGTMKLDSANANVLISGKNGSDNIPVSVTPSGRVLVETTPQTRIGSHNNVYSGNLTKNQFSTPNLNVSAFGKSVISYSDASINSNSLIQLWAGLTENGVYDYIGLLIPITTGNRRFATSILELAPFKYLKIKLVSDATTDNANNIQCSLYSNSL